MPSSIRIGSRVSGAVGPFLPNEASKDTSDFANKKTIRRRRQHFNGTIVGSAKDKKWTVYWDEIKKSADHSCAILKYISPSTLDETDLQIYRGHLYHLGKQNELDMFMKNKNTTKNSTSTINSIRVLNIENEYNNVSSISTSIISAAGDAGSPPGAVRRRQAPLRAPQGLRAVCPVRRDQPGGGEEG